MPFVSSGLIVFRPKNDLISVYIPMPHMLHPMSTLPVWAPFDAMSPAIVKIPAPIVEPIIMAVSPPNPSWCVLSCLFSIKNSLQMSELLRICPDMIF